MLLDMVDWLLDEGYWQEQQDREFRDLRARAQNFGIPAITPSLGTSAFSDAAKQLETILFQGRSAFSVGDPPTHLTERVPAELIEEFHRAISKDDAVSGYLREAWSAAWRRGNPSSKEAYDAAVKALEATLAPIVIPKNTEPTLGKVIRALEDKPEKWDARFRGVETVKAVAAMLDELWKTDSRHAGMPPNSLEQAQDAVTIAVAVVALIRRGFLTRVDDS